MTRWLSTLSFAALALGLPACFSTYNQQVRAAATPDLDAVVAVDPGVPKETSPLAGADDCPGWVSNTQVAVRDVESGVALELTTETGDMDALRARARDLVDLRAARTGLAEGGANTEPAAPEMGGGHSSMFAAGHLFLVPASTTVEDIPGGVRLTFRARNADLVARLRADARAQAPLLAQGACPIPFPRPS